MDEDKRLNQCNDPDKQNQHFILQWVSIISFSGFNILPQNKPNIIISQIHQRPNLFSKIIKGIEKETIPTGTRGFFFLFFSSKNTSKLGSTSPIFSIETQELNREFGVDCPKLESKTRLRWNKWRGFFPAVGTCWSSFSGSWALFLKLETEAQPGPIMLLHIAPMISRIFSFGCKEKGERWRRVTWHLQGWW